MFRIFRSTPARLAITAFALFIGFSLITRIALLIAARHDATWNLSVFGVLATGAWYDVAAATFVAFPWAILGAIIPLRLIRAKVGRVLLTACLMVFTGILIFISVAEWFFWDEFSARFNFIAVDYLVWTQEVWGNINESYPMPAIIAGITAGAGLIVFLMIRAGWFRWALVESTAWQDRSAWPVASLAVPACAWMFVSQSAIPAFTNQFNGELAKNGCWSFFAAFRQMEIDYDQFYLKFPQDQTLAEAKQLLVTKDAPAASDSPNDLRRKITGRGEEKRWNVILVCMESMSGDFMTYLGSKSKITPNLDRLAENSIFFENLYATGTRTVRGMEAITLNLPPTPGQAIIYRPDGVNLVTTFTPFLDRGYDCAFFYGGDGRFDYMNRYFSTSGCRIMDVNAWNPKDVSFKTSWGACDEDLFNKTIEQANANHAAGKPFHFFCMTTSNHRPFDFPSGRLDSAPKNKRKAAVKYADWAIGKLIDDASKQPWFKDTLFVICADHCASSAGKTEIDVTKYHIPAMIYNPGLVQTTKVTRLCSQIDLMPTVFGLLNWNYDTLSYGHDLFAPGASDLPQRAFVSNYQKLGLLQEDTIAILKPNRVTSSYHCDRKTGDFSSVADETTSEPLIHEAAVFYQSASWLFGSGGLKRSNQPQPAQK